MGRTTAPEAPVAAYSAVRSDDGYAGCRHIPIPKAHHRPEYSIYTGPCIWIVARCNDFVACRCDSQCGGWHRASAPATCCCDTIACKQLKYGGFRGPNASFCLANDHVTTCHVRR